MHHEIPVHFKKTLTLTQLDDALLGSLPLRRLHHNTPHKSLVNTPLANFVKNQDPNLITSIPNEITQSLSKISFTSRSRLALDNSVSSVIAGIARYGQWKIRNPVKGIISDALLIGSTSLLIDACIFFGYRHYDYERMADIRNTISDQQSFANMTLEEQSVLRQQQQLYTAATASFIRTYILRILKERLAIDLEHTNTLSEANLMREIKNALRKIKNEVTIDDFRAMLGNMKEVREAARRYGVQQAKMAINIRTQSDLDELHNILSPGLPPI